MKKWTRTTKAIAGAFVATILIAVGMLFSTGLGREDFWEGVAAGLLAVVFVTAAVYAGLKRATPKPASSELHPSPMLKVASALRPGRTSLQ